MKTLFLMRHAKSSWDDPRIDDHDRPLNPRGEHDAPRMGALLEQQGLIPDRIVSSTAVRARTTAEIVARVCRIDDRLTLTPDLYHAPAEEWWRQIQHFLPDDQTVLCVGHNPGIEDFLASSTGQYIQMPTAAIACLSFGEIAWNDVDGEGDADLVSVWRPKELDD